MYITHFQCFYMDFNLEGIFCILSTDILGTFIIWCPARNWRLFFIILFGSCCQSCCSCANIALICFWYFQERIPYNCSLHTIVSRRFTSHMTKFLTAVSVKKKKHPKNETAFDIMFRKLSCKISFFFHNNVNNEYLDKSQRKFMNKILTKTNNT